MEQVQRRAEAKPFGNAAVNLTAPQWHEPASVIASEDAVSIVNCTSHNPV